MNPRTLTLVTALVALLAVAAILIVPRLGGGGSNELDLDGQPLLGDADAPVAIALFEDFRCPHCATFTESVLPRLERDFVESGEARIYYLNFPVLGPASTEVAELGECVYAQDEGTFWEFKPILFRSQGSIESRSQLLDLAKQYTPDLDQGALASCLDGDEAAREVRRDAAMAQELRLGGTPSVLVDGRSVTATYDAIASAVRQALASGD